MKTIIHWVLKNHIAIIFTLIIGVVLGIISYINLPKDVFPNGDFPRFEVIADIGFASLSQTELNLTRPIENALKTVPGVTDIRSVTERGTSTIDLNFKWGMDLKEINQLINTKISEVRSAIPPDTSIEVVKMTTSAFPVTEYGIWSDEMTPEELNSYFKYSVMPQLMEINGIYGIDIIGGEDPEIRVNLVPDAIRKYDLDPKVIEEAITGTNKFNFVGKVIEKKKEFLGFSGNILTNADDLKNIVIDSRMGKPIYLKDVAVVEVSHEEIRRLASINGHRGIFIDIRKQENADAVQLSGLLDKKMNEIRNKTGDDIHIEKWHISSFVVKSIRGIQTDIFLAVLIILLIVYYILERIRYSIPVILILPLIIFLEFLILKIFGQTVNIMTLGGISAAIGIIADNAIVIVENYLRFRKTGSKNPLAESSHNIVLPMLWATFVTIIVFLPLNILTGTAGLFFKPLSITLSTTILISLIVTVFITPIFIWYFIDREKKLKAKETKERFIFRILKKGYGHILSASLKFKWFILAGIILAIGLSVFIFLKLPTGFLPQWDEGNIIMDYIAPAGNSIFATDAMLNEVEKTLKTFPEIKMYIRKTGTHFGTPYSSVNIGEILITLKNKRKKNTFEVIDEIEKKVTEKFPDIDFDFHQIISDRLDDLTGSIKPVVVDVIGNDIDDIRPVAEEIRSKLSGISGLSGVAIDMPSQQNEIKFNTKQEEVSLLGLSNDSVSDYTQTALYGKVITDINQGIKVIPVREIFLGDYRQNLDRIDDIPIYTPNGGIISLGKLAVYSIVKRDTEIHHKNGSIDMSVVAEISGRSLSDVVRDINSTLSGIKNNKVSTELLGDYKNQQTSFIELLVVLLIAVILILTALLFIFESYKTSLAVFLGTISSATFVILGLFITGTEFNVSSFIGLITVMGLVVNNGILVIEFAERFRREGLSIIESVKSAGEIRFRPVLITNLAAIAGFIPMAFNIGQGAEVLYPFSVAMISGLVGSMFFSLIVMPVLYSILHKSTIED